MCDSMCLDSKNELMLCKLCAKKARIQELCADKLITDSFCADVISSHTLNVDQEKANDICVSGKLSASNVAALNLNANNLCSQNGTINKLCVNDLNVVNMTSAVKYRAAVDFAADSLYALGSNVDFDLIIDDPNSNIALAPFSYTAPVAGYYAFDFSVVANNLQGAAPIIGIPTGVMNVTVNGISARTHQSAYLSFNSSQSSNLSGILILRVGDIVRMDYSIQVLDPVSGLIPYVGTVNLVGKGLSAGGTRFEIHYLSSLATVTPVICAQCPVVSIPCQPVLIDCNKESGSSKIKRNDFDDCGSCQ